MFFKALNSFTEEAAGMVMGGVMLGRLAPRPHHLTLSSLTFISLVCLHVQVRAGLNQGSAL